MDRRTVRLPCKFLLPSESKEVTIDSNWSTEYNAHTHEGVVKNIDYKGMFVVAAHPVKLSEIVTIQLELPGYHEKVQFRGVVVWVNRYAEDYPKGFAVKFQDISISVKILRECIEKVIIVDDKFVNLPETLRM